MAKYYIMIYLYTKILLYVGSTRCNLGTSRWITRFRPFFAENIFELQQGRTLINMAQWLYRRRRM